MIGESCLKGIWYLNGTKRDGLTISPYICAELAKQMLGKKNKLVTEFKPSRNLISYFNKEEAIHKAAVAIYNKENTHNMLLADSNNFEEYFNRIKKNVENIYSKHRIKKYGIHPELLSNFKLNIVNKKILKDR